MAQLRSAFEDGNLILAISNPAQRNALDPAMYAAGVEALANAASNPEIGCIIITGDGTDFCAGGNLQRLQANRHKPPEVQAASIEGLSNWIEAIRTCPKPVVAAIEGAAAGAGFSLALACDLIVAADNAIFVMAYSNVGLSPDGGASWHLAHLLPRQLASQLLMGGERIHARRLHDLGVVGRVCDAGHALNTAMAWCSELAGRAPNVLASVKELLGEAATHSLHEHLAIERDHFVKNLHHPNAGIGIGAFLARQTPIYGRPSAKTEPP